MFEPDDIYGVEILRECLDKYAHELADRKKVAFLLGVEDLGSSVYRAFTSVLSEIHGLGVLLDSMRAVIGELALLKSKQHTGTVLLHCESREEWVQYQALVRGTCLHGMLDKPMYQSLMAWPFRIIRNDGRSDRILMAQHLLDARLRRIAAERSQRISESDSLHII